MSSATYSTNDTNVWPGAFFDAQNSIYDDVLPGNDGFLTGASFGGNLQAITNWDAGAQFSYTYSNDVTLVLLDNANFNQVALIGTFNFSEQHDFTLGTQADDTLDLSASTLATLDFIFARAGDDTITGSNHTDQIDLGSGDDVAFGLGGSDTIYGLDGDDIIFGDAGADTITGGNDNDTLFGGTGVDVLHGENGDDKLNGGIEADYLFGGLGNDTYTYNGITNIVELANQGNDKVKSSVTANLLINPTLANIENIELTGTAAINARGSHVANNIIGNAAANQIEGYNGDDVISAGGGNDIIRGGQGKDTMTGGTGRDTFYYGSVIESSASGTAQDILTDFVVDAASRLALTSDRISLVQIDAQAGTAGNGTFSFIGSGNFTAEGQVRAYQSGINTIIEANTTGVSGAELKIILNGNLSLLAGDFIL